MKIIANGQTKLDISGSTSVVKFSGDLGGATVTLGYHDGDNVVPYTTPAAIDNITQLTVEHGVNIDLYLVVDGGTAIDMNVIVGRLNQNM